MTVPSALSCVSAKSQRQGCAYRRNPLQHWVAPGIVGIWTVDTDVCWSHLVAVVSNGRFRARPRRRMLFWPVGSGRGIGQCCRASAARAPSRCRRLPTVPAGTRADPSVPRGDAWATTPTGHSGIQGAGLYYAAPPHPSRCSRKRQRSRDRLTSLPPQCLRSAASSRAGSRAPKSLSRPGRRPVRRALLVQRPVRHRLQHLQRPRRLGSTGRPRLVTPAAARLPADGRIYATRAISRTCRAAADGANSVRSPPSTRPRRQ